MSLGTVPSATQQVVDLRRRPRFEVISPVRATFNGLPIRVVDVSAGGLQMEHASFLRLGTAGTVVISSDEPLEVRTRVVWSRFSPSPQQPGYRSGLAFDGDLEAVAGRLGRFIRAYGRADTTSLTRKADLLRARQEQRKQSMKYMVTRTDRSDDETMLIQHARQQLSSAPDEALKWYNRAKFAMADRHDIAAELSSVPYRQEALAVWEYLERRIDIVRIIGVFESSRR